MADYEGMTVDEILEETAIMGDVSLSMTTEFPGFDGEIVKISEMVNCRCMVIFPRKRD